jgi:hypothetical protein
MKECIGSITPQLAHMYFLSWVREWGVGGDVLSVCTFDIYIYMSRCFERNPRHDS